MKRLTTIGSIDYFASLLFLYPFLSVFMNLRRYLKIRYLQPKVKVVPIQQWCAPPRHLALRPRLRSIVLVVERALKCLLNA